MDPKTALDKLNADLAQELLPPMTAEEHREAYRRRYSVQPTPASHPHLYDPLDPPEGWVYDAAYEFWYKLPDEQDVRWISVITALTIGLMFAAFWLADYLRP